MKHIDTQMLLTVLLAIVIGLYLVPVLIASVFGAIGTVMAVIDEILTDGVALCRKLLRL